MTVKLLLAFSPIIGSLLGLIIVYSMEFYRRKYRKNNSMRDGRSELTKSFNEKASKLS